MSTDLHHADDAEVGQARRGDLPGQGARRSWYVGSSVGRERSDQDNAATVERRRTRARRYALRHRMRAVSDLPSVQACGRSLLQAVGGAQLLRGANGVAGYSGLATCSSVWACPVCSARIRAQRSREVEAAGLAHLRAGGYLGFLTLTLPHDTGDALAELLDTVAQGWRAVQQSRGYKLRREALGLRFIRAVEVTHTRAAQGGSGWHPHLHVLLLSDVELSPDRLRDLEACVLSAWSAYVVSRGWRAPTAYAGTDLQAVVARTGASGLLRYLTKVQDGYGAWSVGAELVRGDLKRGRRSASRVPLEILEGAVAGSVADTRLWREYEAATKGRRCLDKTKGLFDELGVSEVVDELAPEAGPEPETVAVIDAVEWRNVVRFRYQAALLDAAEREGAVGVERLRRALRRRAAFVDREAERRSVGRGRP